MIGNYDFFRFIKGDTAFPKFIGFTEKFKLVVRMLPIMFLLIVFSAMLQMLFLRWGITEEVKSSGMIPDYMRSMSSYRIILEIVILAPVLEEMAFRGPLQRNVVWFRAGLFVLTYLMACRILSINCYEVTLGTMATLLAAAITYFIPEKSIMQLTQILHKPHFRVILIWSASIGFAFWHYYNFDFSHSGVLTIIINLMPFMINGMLLSFVAVKCGIPWSIFLHMANNGWPLLLWL